MARLLIYSNDFGFPVRENHQKSGMLEQYKGSSNTCVQVLLENLTAFSILITLMMSLSLSAQYEETRGKLSLIEDTQESLEIGRTYDFKLVLHPLAEDMFNSQDIEEEKLLPFLYVSKVTSVFPSPNNVDALVVHFRAIVSDKAKTNIEYRWDPKDRNVPISFNIPSIGGDVQLENDFILMERSRDTSLPLTLIVVITLFVLLLLYFLARKFIFHKKEDDPWTLIKKRLLQLSEREQLELLYQERRLILSISPHYEEFFKEIEKVQYSPQWKTMELASFYEEKEKMVREMNDL